MALPIVTAENYYSPEMNMAYMGSTQFKAFEKCEAAALAELKGEYHPPSSTALLVGGYRNVGIADVYENKVAGIYLHHKAKA